MRLRESSLLNILKIQKRFLKKYFYIHEQAVGKIAFKGIWQQIFLSSHMK